MRNFLVLFTLDCYLKQTNKFLNGTTAGVRQHGPAGTVVALLHQMPARRHPETVDQPGVVRRRRQHRRHPEPLLRPPPNRPRGADQVVLDLDDTLTDESLRNVFSHDRTLLWCSGTRPCSRSGRVPAAPTCCWLCTRRRCRRSTQRRSTASSR